MPWTRTPDGRLVFDHGSIVSNQPSVTNWTPGTLSSLSQSSPWTGGFTGVGTNPMTTGLPMQTVPGLDKTMPPLTNQPPMGAPPMTNQPPMAGIPPGSAMPTLPGGGSRPPMTLADLMKPRMSGGYARF